MAARQKNDGRGRLGGRAKGTPNKTTSTIREAIARQWQRYQESGQFQQDLDDLEPVDRAHIMEKYAQYVSPKLKTVDLDVTQQVTLTIEDRLRQLCGNADPDEDDPD